MASLLLDDGGRSAAAGRLLRAAAAQTKSPAPDQLHDLDEAIQILASAPLQTQVDRQLLDGIRVPSERIVDSTADACVRRLAAHPEPEWQDRFIESILDTCFLFLSPQHRATDAEWQALTGRTERAATKLFRAVCCHLKQMPLGLDHHRARILARARSIRQHGGSGAFVQAVLDYQRDAGGTHERSDERTALVLHLSRRDRAYSSGITAEPTLRGYLNQDRDISPAEIPPSLLKLYARLLQVQTKEHAPRAIEAALDNLCHWLDQCIDLQGQQRDELVNAAYSKAAKGLPLPELPWDLRLHVEAHRALLPGAGRDDDLLVQVAERYNFPEAEKLFIATLQTLSRLPLVRTRIDEIERVVLGGAAMQRSESAWSACFDLIDAIITGLADFELTGSLLDAASQRRNRLRRMLTEQDRPLRRLLRRIAFGGERELNLPREQGLQQRIRERAWRSLLRSQPPNRRSLYWQGLHADGGNLFRATLEEAAEVGQRTAWELLRRDWPRWLSAPAEGDEEARRERLVLIVDYWNRTRIYDGVKNDGDALGHILSLALDDPDEVVRQHATRAIVAAGFELELSRERLRRRLEALRQESTACHEQINALDRERNALGRKIDETQLAKAEHQLAIQALQQLREGIVTQGYVSTARMQVDNAELREELVRALARARDELGVIEDLQRRIQAQLREATRFHEQARELVGQQRRAESDLSACLSRLRSAERDLSGATRAQISAESRLNSVRSSRPSQPWGFGSAEQKQQAQEQYQRQLSHWRSEVSSAERALNSAATQVSNCQSTVNAETRRQRQLEDRIRQLRREIDAQRRRIAEIEARLHGLSQELRERKLTWQELRSRIAALQGRVQALEAEMAREQRAGREQIQANTSAQQQEQAGLVAVADALDRLSTRMTATIDNLQRQRTRGQELIQAIDSGRGEYDATGARAATQSALSDTEGVSHERATDQRIRADQEALAIYTYALGRAIEHHPPPPPEPSPRAPAPRPKQRSRQ
jgi:hypothetical protein